MFEKLSGDYVRGYTAALVDLQKMLADPDGLVKDMKNHKKRLNQKSLTELLNLCIRHRAILRENPFAFVRVNSNNEFEIYIEGQGVYEG